MGRIIYPVKEILAAALLVALSACGSPDRFVRISGYAQGGNYSVTVHVKGVGIAPEALRDSVEALLLHIDTTLSGYNRASLLSRFNAGEAVRPNRLFLDMYKMAYGYWKRSSGALDFAAGPLYDAWGFGFRSGSMPSPVQVAGLLASGGMAALPEELPVVDGIVDPSALGCPRLNYNAIAQGLSCDLVSSFLRRAGAVDMLVDIGEIWCEGHNPSGKPWSVGVDRPEDGNTGETPGRMEAVWTSEGRSAGIVTSGNYRKFYIRDGRKYAHTIDPVSGYPVQHNLLSATVVSTVSAADADALATWCMVVGQDAAMQIILGDDTLEGFLVWSDDDGSTVHWQSPGFSLKEQ